MVFLVAIGGWGYLVLGMLSQIFGGHLLGVGLCDGLVKILCSESL